MKNTKNIKGFTLIEILVVIGIIAILAAVVLVALNPARQFAQARNSQRQSNVNAILDAIGQNMADNQGLFKCTVGGVAVNIPTSTPAQDISSATLNLRPCLVPTYMSELPIDPSQGVKCDDPNNCTTYNTDYNIIQDASSSRITVSAPGTELSTSTISVTR
ncbi:MAG: type II secretion system protein [Patescibacteria group bacterium]|nr:type II secretion system GspH family protein [Patescibacteria group bacterium]MDE2015521.1 type II secretion system protein [Patescibacteria group bacterium]MDE2226863.1 type II secretion system protein [Patescibacteria group bacterium]